MRNYVIINGVNSLSIQGLAVNILPTITKAPMRTMREEIDGRDGDITTNLGYGAYDKTLEIGLFGNYNVDDVIAFFNTKGTIVFSDENDKVYNFEIVDQIDFAKLIKFRTATINIHCQPFKYPLNETPIEKTYEFINGTGTTISLSNTANATFGKLELQGNASQTGTPTPSNPIDVDVVSGDNTITIGDGTSSDTYEIDLPVENLLDISTTEVGKAWNNTTALNRAVCYVRCFPNTQYTISYQTKNGLDAIYYFEKTNKEDATAVVGTTGINFTKTITTNASSNWIGIQFNKNAITQEEIEGTQIMIERGSKANKYQPYGADVIELYKIGTAQDYIHKINGGWVIHREVRKIILNGTETWQQDDYASTGYYRYLMTIRGTIYAQTTNINGLNNYFEQRINQGHGAYEYLYLQGSPSGINIYVQIQSTSTLSDFLEWLSNHNINVYYVLQTPIEEAIEDDNLIAQLNELEKAKSYEDTTNITQTNNDLPFILDVSAIKKGSDQAVIVNGGNIYSKPTIDLVGDGIVSLYLEGVQMFKVDLSEDNEIVIDTDKMEAINPNTLELANRQVIGDYSKFKLEVGSNNLSADGNITSATFTKYTRWL